MIIVYIIKYYKSKEIDMCQLTANPLNQQSLSPLPIPELLATSKKRTARLKFWDLKSHFHCAALGTCLTLKELRQIGKKAGIEGIHTWTDYEMHVSFIHVLDSKSYVSNMINKLLDKKYKLAINQFSKTKSEQDRYELWNKTVLTGDIAGAFWAILTHPDSDDNTLTQVYGKVHMLSHLSGATARIDMKEFFNLEKYNESLEDLVKKSEIKAKTKLEKKERQLSKLKIQLAEAQTGKNNLQSALQELETIKNNPLLESLQKKFEHINSELENSLSDCKRAESAEKKWKQRATDAQAEKQSLQQQLHDLKNENTSVETSLASILGSQQDGEGDCASCPNSDPDLCGRCVLYIGGRSSQYSYFRQLVEQKNGTFIHHDGGREDGHQKLASIVSKADVVFCPLDCVSHNAMNAVKRHCQNNAKQLVFIPHASLSSFAKGLDDVATYEPQLRNG